MKSNEIPPRDEEKVETFRDSREVSKTATQEAQMQEIFEKSAEAGGLSEENKQKIAKLKSSIETDRLIQEALDKKDDGSEPYEDVRSDEEKQQPEKRPAKKVGGLKKLAMILGFIGAGAAGQAKGHEKNPVDSTGAKKEKVLKVENSAEVTNKLRQDWSDYVKWLKELGLQGNEALDHNDLGGAMIDRYKKEHPGTSISRENIAAIQAEFAKYREWVLEETKAGRSQFRSKADEEAFLNHLSKIDNWAGSETTKYEFPHAYLVSLEKGGIDYGIVGNTAILRGAPGIDADMTHVMKKDAIVKKIEDKGFATSPNVGNDNIASSK